MGLFSVNSCISSCISQALMALDKISIYLILTWQSPMSTYILLAGLSLSLPSWRLTTFQTWILVLDKWVIIFPKFSKNFPKNLQIYTHFDITNKIGEHLFNFYFPSGKSLPKMIWQFCVSSCDWLFLAALLRGCFATPNTKGTLPILKVNIKCPESCLQCSNLHEIIHFFLDIIFKFLYFWSMKWKENWPWILQAKAN